MTTYVTDESKLGGVHFTEKVDCNTGWQFVCLEEEWTRGYLQQIQDFMECVAIGRQPLADLELACGTIRIQYGGYWGGGRPAHDPIEGWTPVPRRLSCAPRTR